MTLAAVATTVLVALAFHWLRPDWEIDPQGGIWWKMAAIAITMVSMGLAWIEPRAPWRWPMVMAFSFYFLGLFFVFPDWGTLLPFELVFAGLHGLPGVVAAYATSALAARFAQSDRH